MSVPSNIPAKVIEEGNDTTGSYDFPFRVEAVTDIEISIVEEATGTAETYDSDSGRFTATWLLWPQEGGTVELQPFTLNPGELPYLDGSGFLKSGFSIVIVYAADARQPTTFRNTSNMTPVNVEKALDRLTMAIKAAIDLSKQALRLETGDEGSPVFPPLLGNENRGVYVNASATGFAYGPTVNDIQSMVDAAAQSAVDSAQSAADAAAQVVLAEAQVALAEQAVADAQYEVSLASQAAIDAVAAKDLAEQAVADATDQVALAVTAANNSEASAIKSEVSANRTLFTEIVNLDVSDSPYLVGPSDENKMFNVDTSGGSVTIQLPLMSTVDDDFKIGVVKATDPNQVIVSRNIGNTINSGGDVVISDEDFGLVIWPIFPGTDWKARFFILESASSGGSGGGGFIIDSTTQLVTTGGQITPLGSAPQQELRVAGNGGPQDASTTPFDIDASHGDVITIRGTDSTDYVMFPTADVDYGLVMPADFYATKGASVTVVADMVNLRYYQIARTDMP